MIFNTLQHHCKGNYNAYLATIETPEEDLFLRDHTKRLFKNGELSSDHFPDFPSGQHIREKYTHLDPTFIK